MSIRRVIFLAVLIVWLASLLVGRVDAQGMALAETFDDPSLPGWEHSPNAAVVDGALRVESGGFAFHPGGWSDFTLSVRMRWLVAGEGALALTYRASDAGEYALVLNRDLLVLLRRAVVGSRRRRRWPCCRPSMNGATYIQPGSKMPAWIVST